MSPEATYDILSILERTSILTDELSAREVHTLAYLACLLYIYDGGSIERWGYTFCDGQSTGPFSEAISVTLDALESAGCLGESETRYSIKSEGRQILVGIRTDPLNSMRDRYLFGASDAIMSRPIPFITSALESEPMLSSSKVSMLKYLLGKGPSFGVLKEQASALKAALGSRSQDVWLAALAWLDYWMQFENREVMRVGN